MKKFCLICEKKLDFNIQKCCTQGSVVAYKKGGFLNLQTEYFSLDGKKLNRFELSKLEEAERKMLIDERIKAKNVRNKKIDNLLKEWSEIAVNDKDWGRATIPEVRLLTIGIEISEILNSGESAFQLWELVDRCAKDYQSLDFNYIFKILSTSESYLGNYKDINFTNPLIRLKDIASFYKYDYSPNTYFSKFNVDQMCSGLLNKIKDHY
jgi:hypothetical protein